MIVQNEHQADVLQEWIEHCNRYIINERTLSKRTSRPTVDRIVITERLRNFLTDCLEHYLEAEFDAPFQQGER
jgi:hypothetical protein